MTPGDHLDYATHVQTAPPPSGYAPAAHGHTIEVAAEETPGAVKTIRALAIVALIVGIVLMLVLLYIAGNGIVFMHELADRLQQVGTTGEVTP